jgi:hypothetical protein
VRRLKRSIGSRRETERGSWRPWLALSATAGGAIYRAAGFSSALHPLSLKKKREQEHRRIGRAPDRLPIGERLLRQGDLLKHVDTGERLCRVVVGLVARFLEIYERGCDRDKFRGERLPDQFGSGHAQILSAATSKLLANLLHLSMREGATNLLAQARGRSWRDEIGSVRDQEMEERLVRGGDGATKARLTRSLRLSAREMAGLLQQVVR